MIIGLIIGIIFVSSMVTILLIDDLIKSIKKFYI